MPHVDELTDWHNLLQGALGAFVGSVLAVGGAFAVAAWTVRRDHRLSRQQSGREAALRLQKALDELASALLGLGYTREDEAYLLLFNEPEVRERITAPSDSFANLLREVDPDLPKPIAGRLHMLMLGAWHLARDPSPPSWSEAIESVRHEVDQADLMLTRYRRDPLGEIKRLDREARRRRWRRRLSRGTSRHQAAAPPADS